MKHKTNKKILIIFSLIILSTLLLSSFSLAQKPLEVDYPEVFGETLPEKPVLPEYIKYIFNLALLLGGLVAFGALVYGGFRYLTSVGSPAAMDDAKNQITAGILGLVILLASYLILTTVNPQLAILKMKKPFIEQGVILNPGTANEQYVRVSISNLQAVFGETFNAQTLKFLTSPSDIKARVCSNIDYNEPCQEITAPDTNTIVSLPAQTKSISLHLKLPGIYLVKDEEEIFLSSDIPNLALNNFEDKATQIKFKLSKSDVQNGTKYGAILHEDREYQGQAKIFLSSQGPFAAVGDGGEVIQTISGATAYGCVNNVSSAHIFTITTSTGDIKLCKNVNCEGTSGTDWISISSPEELIPVNIDSFGLGGLNDNLKAIEINGNYLVVVFANHPPCTTGLNPQPYKSQVFKTSNPDLTKEPIGDCGFVCYWWLGPICVYSTTFLCPSSVAIYPIK
ncbi:hypothetical protein AMJ49_04775 [Parcubacteria bacterium DG_74_2]|nr:MAG: hypothetical protein AMJ49_04775 [Parcubacteria bacterium DG_74_2]